MVSMSLDRLGGGRRGEPVAPDFADRLVGAHRDLPLEQRQRLGCAYVSAGHGHTLPFPLPGLGPIGNRYRFAS